MEERRLGYVAYTRAEERLVLSGHWWGRTQIKPRGPSEFLLETRDWLVDAAVTRPCGLKRPTDDATNPHLDTVRRADWPAAPPVLARSPMLSLPRVREILDRPDQPAQMLPTDPGRSTRPIERRCRPACLPRRTPWLPRQRVVALPGDGVGHVDARACRGSRRVRARAGPPDAAPAVACRPFRHPVPRLGRGALRPTGAARPGRTAGPRRCRSSTRTPSWTRSIQVFSDGAYGQRAPHAIEAPFSIVLGGPAGRSGASTRSSPPRSTTAQRSRSSTGRPTRRRPPTAAACRSIDWPGLSSTASTPPTSTGAFYYVRLGQTCDTALRRPARPRRRSRRCLSGD